MKEAFINELKHSQEYLERSTRCLEEEHSGHAAAEGMMTVAQQVAHIAHTVEWFLDGVQSDAGFNMDFEKGAQEILAVTSLAEARKWIDKAYTAVIEYIQNTPEDELRKPVTAGVLMIGMPRFGIAASIVDHTAHHRGALTVYARTLGLTPGMPYMEEMPAQ